MECNEVVFSGHAVRRMFERAIEAEDVRRVLHTGQVIAEYPDDQPMPSTLLLGIVGPRPLHVVAARDAERSRCIVVTCYEPDPALWTDQFTRRRT